jgi:hypothetical protein
VIASGDLLHSFFRTIGDGYPREWPATLRSIQQLEFQKQEAVVQSFVGDALLFQLPLGRCLLGQRGPLLT